MTRLHYPREFRQQSPAVYVKNTRVLAHTQKKRQLTLSLGHELIHEKGSWTVCKKKCSASQSLSSGSFRIQAMGESTIYTFFGGTSSPRRHSEYKPRPRNGPFFPEYFKRRRIYDSPWAKIQVLVTRNVVQMAVLPRSFFSRFRERRLENGGYLRSLGFESDKHRRAVCARTRASVCVCCLLVGGRHFSYSPLE